MMAFPNGGTWTYRRSLLLAAQYSAIVGPLAGPTRLIHYPAKRIHRPFDF